MEPHEESRRNVQRVAQAIAVESVEVAERLDSRKKEDVSWIVGLLSEAGLPADRGVAERAHAVTVDESLLRLTTSCFISIAQDLFDRTSNERSYFGKDAIGGACERVATSGEFHDELGWEAENVHVAIRATYRVLAGEAPTDPFERRLLFDDDEGLLEVTRFADGSLEITRV